MVIIRKMITTILSTSGRICSEKLFRSLENLNNSVINDVLNRPQPQINNDEDREAFEQNECQMFTEVNKLMSMFGMADPLQKIYITSDPIDNLPLFMFFLVNYLLPTFQMDKNLGILVKKKKDESLDYSYLLYGSISFLNQFHNSNTEIFLAYMAQYIKSGNFHISQIKDSKTQAEIKSEIANNVIFFEDFIRTSGLDNDYAEGFLPLSLLKSSNI
mmetsp:Transcript_7593/g.6880  ORF Transcript_7593/g.6880 Transcript_7593/m.6880 type:complete len:216 (-) Transcript_7593:25-672(-)